jgi:hypothetical protein
MLISIDKKPILKVLEESTTERKLTRIPILATAGAIVHPIIGASVEQSFGDGADLSPEHLANKAMIGAGVGTLMGTINYFRKDGGVGPTSQIGQFFYPIKKN